MRDHFDISGVFETTEFEIAQVACYGELTDFSALFPDVVNCMQTDNLELKKLVYLYLMNYAKSQPDMAIMAVNTFVKVCVTRYIYSTLVLPCCISLLL